eukprot:198715-Rhodomonas_salina.1
MTVKLPMQLCLAVRASKSEWGSQDHELKHARLIAISDTVSCVQIQISPSGRSLFASLVPARLSIRCCPLPSAVGTGRSMPLRPTSEST